MVFSKIRTYMSAVALLALASGPTACVVANPDWEPQVEDESQGSSTGGDYDSSSGSSGGDDDDDDAPTSGTVETSTGNSSSGCGDGVLDEGEACDDGNDINDDECTNNCTLPECGDGILQEAEEESCDDGNVDDTDMCTVECELASCGDGIIQGVIGETCDDGDNSDLCTEWCHFPPDDVLHGDSEYSDQLGNGLVDKFELCGNGSVLVGLEVRGGYIGFGNTITGFKPSCADLVIAPEGDGWALEFADPELGTWVGAPLGENLGLTPCLPGYAVTEFSGRRDNGLFKWITLGCTELLLDEDQWGFHIDTGGYYESALIGFNENDQTFGPNKCPAGMYATGVRLGLSESILGSVVLECHELVVN